MRPSFGRYCPLLIGLLLHCIITHSIIAPDCVYAQSAGSAKLTTSQPVKAQRKALLIAAQEGTPEMQEVGGPFPALKYPTRDVVLLYMALKNPEQGRFDAVTVLASRRQLDALRDQEIQRLQDPTLDEAYRVDAALVITGVDRILADPDTDPDTVRPLSTLVGPNSTLLASEKKSLIAERQLQCHALAGQAEAGRFADVGAFPCSKDVEDAVAEFKTDLAEDDEGLVYFSGHGFRTSAFKNGLLSVGDRALVTADSYVELKSPDAPSFNTVSVGSLLDSLGEDDCKRLVVVLAACAGELPKGLLPGQSPVEAVGYLPPQVKRLRGKSGTWKQVIGDRDLRTLTVLGASKEEAFESTQLPILGDVFTFYLRTAIENRLSRLGTDYQAVNLDRDRDGAYSVEEVFDFVEVQTRRVAPQEPHMLRLQGNNSVYALRGIPNASKRKAIVYPPSKVLLKSSKSKGVGPNSDAPIYLQLRVDGKVQAEPDQLDAGLHTFELIGEGTAVLEKVLYDVAPGEQLRFEQLFGHQAHHVDVATGVSSYFGPSAYPDSGNHLWTSGELRLGYHRTLLSRADESRSLDLGGFLMLGSSLPPDGNYFQTQYHVTLAGGLRVRQRLELPTSPELRLGFYPAFSYLSLFDYRKSMLVGSLGGDVGLSWRMKRDQQLSLTLSVQGRVADLDCQTTNTVPSTVDYTSEEIIAHRCETEGVGLYVAPALWLGWGWGF